MDFRHADNPEPFTEERTKRTARSRAKDVSNALSEVRTVLSRAETALDALRRDKEREGEPMTRWVVEGEPPLRRGRWEEFAYETDPDINSMIHEMEQAILHLEPWRGARKSRGQRTREWYASRSTT